jgi:hypothetical protein
MVIAIATQALAAPVAPAPAQPPRLLDQLLERALQRGHRQDTAAVYVEWSRRYILFHWKRHPNQLGQAEIRQFLAHVAQVEAQPLAAIAVARTALEFLYAELLQNDIGELPWVRPPRLLDQVHQVMRVRHYSLRTEGCYVQWITRYVRFHGMRHPRDIRALEVQQFLIHLAVAGRVSASTQNQGLNRN